MKIVTRSMLVLLLLAPALVWMATGRDIQAQAPAAAAAIEPLHFHHVHLNSTDPKAAAARKGATREDVLDKMAGETVDPATGEPAAAARLMQAIETVTATPELHTRDLGGTAITADVTQAVCRQLAATAR